MRATTHGNFFPSPPLSSFFPFPAHEEVIHLSYGKPEEGGEKIIRPPPPFCLSYIDAAFSTILFFESSFPVLYLKAEELTNCTFYQAQYLQGVRLLHNNPDFLAKFCNLQTCQTFLLGLLRKATKHVLHVFFLDARL